MFNDVCTIYNKYIDAGGEKWKRTVLNGVFWDSSKGANIRRTGVSAVDGLLLLIPRNVTATGEYMKPKVWASLSDKAGYWTLQSGDTVILGNVDYEVVKSSKELQQYDDVLNISTIDSRSFGGGMAHWEVGGK